jgi:hypothetical protein
VSLVLEQVDLGMDAVRIDEVQAVERTEAAVSASGAPAPSFSTSNRSRISADADAASRRAQPPE